MPSLLERVSKALSPRYEVESEVASGGMATVFRARDTALHRPVAVKVLRPEMATATGEGRFLREARTLASISHPNVVAIHDVDQRGGLSFYVMDFIDGQTLRERLEEGPLDASAALRLGQELLGALGRLHDAGIVHRDVKPSNVFLTDGRALLADFGIVQLEGSDDETLTAEGHGPGTPAYMSPEQARGSPVTASSDLYSLGMILYEALTGSRWWVGQAPEAGDWSGIPAAMRPALRKALALDPEQRWKDARAFRDALRTRGPGIRVPHRVAALGVVAAAVLVWWAVSRGGSGGSPDDPGSTGLSDVALFPCTAASPADSSLGRELGWRIFLNLEGVPGIHAASWASASTLYERIDGEVESSDWSRVLGSSHALRCVVDSGPEGLHVDLRLIDAAGNVIYARAVTATTGRAPERLRQAAVDASLDILNVLAPGVTLSAEEVDRFAGHPKEAVIPFLQGEDAARRGAWRTAERHYEEALEQDSTLTLARWRLAEAERWQADRTIGADLSAIRAMDLSTLSHLDSLLLEAGAMEHGRDQLRAYEAILAMPQYRLHPYVTLLYADELYHRGPLWGVAIDSAIAMFRRAVERDSSLVPAVEHLTQALIRTGREDEAAVALERLRRIHASEDESEVYYPDVWLQGFNEKFRPDEAITAEGRLVLSRRPLQLFAMFSRFVRYIDAPKAQAEYGRLLVEAADRQGDAAYAAQGFVDRGLGLIGTDRVEEGIAAFDSAARRYETPQSIAQAAEWAVIPYALGLAGFEATRAAIGEQVLAAMWSDPAMDPCLRMRAAVAMALLADRRGDERDLTAWAKRLDSLAAGPTAGAGRPARLVSALAAASSGKWREALNGTGVDMAYDSVGLAERPFLRSALYLKRAEWYGELGMADSAAATRLWHENTDLEGAVEPELVQAGEVDGALGDLIGREREREAP